ncbi:MAG TPA: hypothetical protein VK957_10785 [Lunatimonas sp.]|nr:hypothetical protein [Lunatimonas sp.]
MPASLNPKELLSLLDSAQTRCANAGVVNTHMESKANQEKKCNDGLKI